MRDFRELLVWQKAKELVKAVYSLTASFPDKERFGLVSQMQRAAVSVMTNIAEGHGRVSDGDFARFLSMAIGSSNELESLMIVSREMSVGLAQGYEPVEGLQDEVKKMLYGLRSSLAERPAARNR